MWPSYAKVCATAAGNFGVWWAVRGISNHMAVTDLVLTSPVGNVSCIRGGNRWPRIGEGGLWSYEGGEFAEWLAYDRNPEKVFGTLDVTSKKCSTVKVSLDELEDLGVGYADPHHGVPGYERVVAAIAAYILSFLVAIWVSIHDLSLIAYNPRRAITKYEKDGEAVKAERNRMTMHLMTILDVHGVKKTAPKCWRFWTRIVSCSCGGQCCPCPKDLGASRCILAYILSIIAFVTIVCPLVVMWGIWDYLQWLILTLCGQKPDYNRGRLSRLVVFCLCCISAAMYVGIVIYLFTFIISRSKLEAEVYAVVFHQGDEVCGCHYPMSKSKCTQILFIFLGNALFFIGVGTKTLKGLRCSTWATLITAQFPVPIALYPVQWKYNGDFIQHRDSQKNSEGEEQNRICFQPVQAEPAFDPFALLDEQPNSSVTYLSLQPRFEIPAGGTADLANDLERADRPNRPEARSIECCGFPWKFLARARAPEEGFGEGLLQGS